MIKQVVLLRVGIDSGCGGSLDGLQQIERRIRDAKELGGRNFESTGLGLVREISRGPFEAFSTELFTECEIEHLNPRYFRLITLPHKLLLTSPTTPENNG